MWGSAESANDEILFVVGSKAYPTQTHYFVVDSGWTMFFLSDEHKKELHRECESATEVVSTVIELLKEWFPAKKI